MRKIGILSAAIALLVCVLLLLSGCASMAKRAAENAVKKAASDAGVSYNEKSGGVTVSTDSGTAQIGGTISWPKDWPGDLPKLNGTITAVSDTGLDHDGGIYMSLEVSGPDVVKNYAAQLEQLGFTKIIESSGSDEYAASYSSSKYSVSVSVDSENKAALIVGQGSGDTASDSSSG